MSEKEAVNMSNWKMFRHFLFLEIAGVCNAKCYFCCTGNKTHTSTGFMDAGLFREILAKIYREFGGIQLNLYNWGEPLLHPEFELLISEICRYPGMTYGISTNAGVTQGFTAEMASRLAYLRFSMPGFSQESYDRIHRLDFELVKKNITGLVTQIQGFEPQSDIYIDMHHYTFNENELSRGKEFAESLNIGFRTPYAYINDWEQKLGYIQGKVSSEYQRRVDEWLCLGAIRLERLNAPKEIVDYSYCWIAQRLVINSLGQVMTCCSAPYNDPRFVIGDFLKLNISEIEAGLARGKPVCQECCRWEVNAL